MIISGITFFIIYELIAIYERYWESEEITTAQVGKLLGCFINQDQIDASIMEESTTPHLNKILYNIKPGYLWAFLKSLECF